MLTTARFCAHRIELGIAEHWYDRTALEDITGIPLSKINDDRPFCDQRSDCKQVCIGLVCSSEALPLSFEVFAGSRTYVGTVEQIVPRMSH